ncbi:adenylate kinase protein [Halorhabdus tiamatea SARL4B]|uniref:Putative adenylate kinase n=1 Tax=Halorhabdus tiamatea SARL4B TaxID=1033806 RepID=F7PMV0_9EURY|nr:adenylate kinase family protein [Halorhabdus tiamatea]ERJ07658.1 adenylate kinase protein [Halorhabdus tiamatea SARL4B]CCQ32686.1 AMP/CMP kinase AK6 [Halorhabdus tiamatea SARL4B]
MRVAVTGTPGTGKTTASEHVETDLGVIHLNEVIEREGFTQGVDDERGSTIADLDAVERWLDGREDVLVESHLAHHVPVDRVIVLRCHPETIEQRLTERGESPESARENAESEVLDVILTEAVDRQGIDSVYEIETTDRSPGAVAEEIEAVIAGDRDPSAGTVSYVEYL